MKKHTGLIILLLIIIYGVSCSGTSRPDVVNESLRLQDMLNHARQLYLDGDYTSLLQSIDYLEQAIVSNPDSAGLIGLLAECCAWKVFYDGLGGSMNWEGIEKAMTLSDKALSINPEMTSALRAKINILVTTHQFAGNHSSFLISEEEIQELADMLYDVDRSDGENIYAIWRAKDYGNFSSDLLQEANNRAPYYVFMYLEIGVLLFQANNLEGAKDIFTLMADVNPDSSIANYYLGEIAAVRNPSIAMDYLEKSLELEPDNFFALIKAGMIYFQNQDYDRASELLSHAYELGHMDFNTIQILALISENMEDYEQSIEYWEQGLSFASSIHTRYAIREITYRLFRKTYIEYSDNSGENFENAVRVINAYSLFDAIPAERDYLSEVYGDPDEDWNIIEDEIVVNNGQCYQIFHILSRNGTLVDDVYFNITEYMP